MLEALDEKRPGSRRKDLMSPCKGCSRKKPGCHDHCEDYTAWRAVLEAKKEYERQHVLDTLDRDWWYSQEEKANAARAVSGSQCRRKRKRNEKILL